MSSTKVFEAIDDFLQHGFFPLYDNIGNVFNTFLVLLGFFGFGYWMNWQRKFNERAKNNPNQIK